MEVVTLSRAQELARKHSAYQVAKLPPGAQLVALETNNWDFRPVAVYLHNGETFRERATISWPRWMALPKTQAAYRLQRLLNQPKPRLP